MALVDIKSHNLWKVWHIQYSNSLTGLISRFNCCDISWDFSGPFLLEQPNIINPPAINNLPTTCLIKQKTPTKQARFSLSFTPISKPRFLRFFSLPSQWWCPIFVGSSHTSHLNIDCHCYWARTRYRKKTKIKTKECRCHRDGDLTVWRWVRCITVHWRASQSLGIGRWAQWLGKGVGGSLGGGH